MLKKKIFSQLLFSSVLNKYRNSAKEGEKVRQLPPFTLQILQCTHGLPVDVQFCLSLSPR